MRCGVADSAGWPVVVDLEALYAFAARDQRVRNRPAARALIVNGLATLLLHRPGHTATTLVD